MTRAQERLLEALDFLAARSDAMARAPPIGKKEEWATVGLWYPMEPVYSWPSHYGDFTPATMAAGVRRGLIDEPRKHAYRITPESRGRLQPPDRRPAL